MTSETLHTTKLEIPKIGLGTYKLNDAEGQQAILHALEVGYRHIDTAKMYANETEVGNAIRLSQMDRDSIFVTTKIWPSDFNDLLAKTEDSLRQLRTDHVDLLLLHWPTDELTNQRGAELLLKAQEKGYAKHIGVSNFTIAQLKTTLEIAPIVCNQVEYHPFLGQTKMLDFLRDNALFLTAYRPLALGNIDHEALLQSLAEKHQKTVGQIVLRWLIQQQDVVVIPKSGNKARQLENISIFDFELSEDEMHAMFALNRNERLTNPETAPRWD
ncbi:MAG: aldo/keto reductase [Crocinitomicaceae bacterium]|nr:MAG: aldo/keto reductase [Crocinitomicaceae bacterium]